MLFTTLPYNFKRVSTVIVESSAESKDMYLPGEYIFPIDREPDAYPFFLLSKHDKLVRFQHFEEWGSTSRHDFILIPRRGKCLLLVLPPVVFTFIFLTLLLMLAVSPFSGVLLILFAGGLLFHLSNYLRGAIDKIDVLMNDVGKG